MARPGTKGALPYKGQSPFFSFPTAPDLALTAAVVFSSSTTSSLPPLRAPSYDAPPPRPRANLRRTPRPRRHYSLSLFLSHARPPPRDRARALAGPLQPRAAAPSAPDDNGRRRGSVARAVRGRPRGHARPHRRPSPAPRACLQQALFRALFSFSKILQNFSDSPSHRTFRRMHGVLNIDKNKN